MKSPAPADPRLDRILDFIQDTVADGSFSEPAGRGAGHSVSYDEDSIRAFIAEIFPAPDPYAIKAAISLAMQDERDGKPCGCIVAAGCEVRGYGDPDYAADGFLDGAVEAVLQALGPQPTGTAVAPPAPIESPADVIGYCWEINADHPRLIGKPYNGGGDQVALGQRGPIWFESPIPSTPWGLTQIWIMRNGQEVRATWKEPPAIDPTFRPPLISSPEACWPEEEARAQHAARRAKERL